MRHPFEKVISALLATDAHTATAILTPTFVIRATHVRFKAAGRGKVSRQSIEVTFGRPNADTRKFIKQCQQAGERFPIRKIRLQGNMRIRK